MKFNIASLLILLLFCSQLTCRHGGVAADPSPETSEQPVADCLEFLHDEDHLDLEVPYIVEGPPIALRNRTEIMPVSAEAFDQFQRLYTRWADPDRPWLMNQNILVDFAEYIHVKIQLDRSGITTTAEAVEDTFGEVRSRFPDDESFERFLADVGGSPAILRAAICRDLRVEAYLMSYADDEILAMDRAEQVGWILAQFDQRLLRGVVEGEEFYFAPYEDNLRLNPQAAAMHEVDVYSLYDVEFAVDFVHNSDEPYLEMYTWEWGGVFPRNFYLPLGTDIRFIISTYDIAHAMILYPDGLIIEGMPGQYRSGLLRVEEEGDTSGLVATYQPEGMGIWTRHLGTLAYRDLRVMEEVSVPGQGRITDENSQVRRFECVEDCPPGPEAMRSIIMEVHTLEGIDQWVNNPTSEQLGRNLYMGSCARCHGAQAPGEGLDVSTLVEQVFTAHESLKVGDEYDGDLGFRQSLQRIEWVLAEGHEEELVALISYLYDGETGESVGAEDILKVSCGLGLVPQQQPVPPGEREEVLAAEPACEPEVRQDLEGLAEGRQERLELGRQNYSIQCASCHGVDGRGDTPAGRAIGVRDFNNPDHWQQGASLMGAYRAIADGVEGTAMPAYSHLSQEVLWAMTEYISQWNPEIDGDLSDDDMVEEICRLHTSERRLVYDPCQRYGIPRAP